MTTVSHTYRRPVGRWPEQPPAMRSRVCTALAKELTDYPLLKNSIYRETVSFKERYVNIWTFYQVERNGKGCIFIGLQRISL